MKRSLTRIAAAAAIAGLTSLPAAAQSSGSGATDQQGSQPGSHVQPGGSGQEHGATPDKPGGHGAVSAGQPDAKSTTAKGDDRTFLAQAAAGGMAEVQFGKLASQKASDPEVKQFAQKMVEDHTKANQKLEAIAKGMNFAAPHALKPEDQEAYDRLSKLSGEAFDRAYVQHMVKDHQKDVQLFRTYSTSASSPEVKAFASSTLPTLQKHYEEVQQLQQQVGGARATTGAKTDDQSKPRSPEGAPAGSPSSAGSERPPR
jgi:putative membrane protein